MPKQLQKGVEHGVDDAHDCERSPDDGEHVGEEAEDGRLSLLLEDRADRRHLVVEVHAGHAAAGAGGQVAQVLGHRVLIALGKGQSRQDRHGRHKLR